MARFCYEQIFLRYGITAPISAEASMALMVSWPAL
jgi:hypothetical protein